MTDRSEESRKQHRQFVMSIVVGLLFLVVALVLSLDVVSNQDSQVSATSNDSVYSYGIKQSIDQSVEYFPSSFFEEGPGSNNGYVAALTDKIGLTFHYNFLASSQQSITYVYSVKAVLNSKYSLPGSGKGLTNVWAKEYQLVAPVTETKTTDHIAIDQSVVVPYVEYTSEINQLNQALSLVMENNVTVIFSVSVNGSITGEQLNDTRSSTVTAAIGPQVFGLDLAYDKSDSKQITPESVHQETNRSTQIKTILAIIFAILALAAFIYASTKRIFKSQYQRELAKIYRYHEGIIVRAKSLADLSGKCIMPVKSFDDMLNIEEELKIPIIATSAGAEATRFTILNGDTVYEYVLGVLPRPVTDSIHQAAHADGKLCAAKPIPIQTRPKRRPPPKIQG